MSDRLYSVRCHGQLSWPAGRCRHWTRVPLHLVMSTTNRCRFCAAVEGAILQLNDLIAEQPWWETEGRVGDPDHEQVEADRAEAVAALLDDLSAGREEEERTYEGGLTTALFQKLQHECVDLRDRLVLSFIATAGQGLTEAEAYGLPAAEVTTATTAAVEEEEEEEEEEEKEEGGNDDDDDDDDVNDPSSA